MASSFDSRRLREICTKQETITQATAILSMARLKTASGSGHELGSLASGLTAICAYIASKRLNNNDITQKNAQVASCLRPQDFEKALGIVESAISGPKPTNRTRKSTGVTYQSLFRSCEVVESPTMVRVMHEAEEYVFQEVTDASRREVICLVFFWACKVLRFPNCMSPERFQETYDISQNNYNFIIKILQKKCNSQKEALKREWQALQGAQSAKASASPLKATVRLSSSPSKSPSKRPLRVLPSNDTHKHNVELYPPTTDAESIPLPSPTKRRKLAVSSASEENATQSINAAQELKSIAGPSSSRHEPFKQPHPPPVPSTDVPVLPDRSRPSRTSSPSKPSRTHTDESIPMDVDEVSSSESDSSPAPLVSRRFRPVFLDHKQWYRRDPRLSRIWRAAEAHKDNMVKLHGHPFEQYRPES